jgi:sterol desaturase/sphingolipid hydroxylase (fatty acid hydroxylase superfamily)
MLQQLYLINLIVFISGVALFGIAEYFFASRKYTDSKITRWGENFGLTLINTIIIRVLFFITPISVAVYMSENSLGLFTYFNTPEILAGIVMFFLLDLIIYGEHVLFHKVPLLWKFHSVHHSDLDMDFTTALRFHYVEAMVSVITKI